jgi:hypothetical protein
MPAVETPTDWMNLPDWDRYWSEVLADGIEAGDLDEDCGQEHHPVLLVLEHARPLVFRFHRAA